MTKREKAALKEIGELFLIVRIKPIPERHSEFTERVHSCLISLYCGESISRVYEKIDYAWELLGPHLPHLDDYIRRRLHEEPKP